MNEIEKSSDRIKIGDLLIRRDLLRPYKGEYNNTYEFDYFEIKTRDGYVYKVDQDDYDRIVSAINDGVKLVRIGDDLISVHYIDKIKKKIGYK